MHTDTKRIPPWLALAAVLIFASQLLPSDEQQNKQSSVSTSVKTLLMVSS